MTEQELAQQKLDRAVATATGDDLCEIRRCGFSLADPLNVNFDPEPDDLRPQVVDWDELDQSRNVAIFQ